MADIVWRQRWRAAFFSLFLAVMFAAAVALGDPARAFGASMGMAFGLGPMLTLWHVPRSIWYLPIARRDIWRAGWLLSTLGVTLLTTAVKLAALLVPQVRESFGFASVMLSSVYDFAYAGVGCGLVILTTRPQPTSGPAHRVSAFVRGLTEVALVLGFMLAWWGSWAVRDALPTHWTDLTAWSTGALAVALGLTAITYFHSPEPPTPSNRLPGRPRVKTGAPGFEPGGLSGLPRLLVPEYAWSTLFGSGLVVAFGGLVFVFGGLMRSPESYGGILQMQRLLLLDDALAVERGRVFDLIIWCGLFAATLFSRFPFIMRHLRVLPVSAFRLNVLLVLWPALMLLTVWVGLVGLHSVVLGRPVESLQPAWLVALIGSSAIARAVHLRWPGSGVWAGTLWICAGPALRLLNGPSSAVLVILGLGGIAAAAALNHATLLRSSTYRRKASAFGIFAAPTGP
jgi:hypothetical protein